MHSAQKYPGGCDLAIGKTVKTTTLAAMMDTVANVMRMLVGGPFQGVLADELQS